ncbi:uncharacterized protein C8A04DRAFT_33170 [Dichotomopilus funicola]|uniref:Uncharacterized protein n=1 Tax=Dichotomopilus funicola TaxID=1934379 RepID=A0AAN6UWX0_9PEZI|nr:hypothetical protein C8A04DRAFT_33170 [Dichotomopilus funicola]
MTQTNSSSLAHMCRAQPYSPHILSNTTAKPQHHNNIAITTVNTIKTITTHLHLTIITNTTTAKMCHWERATYANCGHSELQKMAYSCQKYRRHVYGPCVYNARYDSGKVVNLSPALAGFCSECSQLFQYVNYDTYE